MQPEQPIHESMAQAIADRLRVIGNPRRIQLLARLREGAATASELRRDIDSSHHNVVSHLQALQGAGVVRRAGTGPNARYLICDESPCEVYDLIIAGLTTPSEAAA